MFNLASTTVPILNSENTINAVIIVVWLMANIGTLIWFMCNVWGDKSG